MNVGVLYADMVGAFDSIHRELVNGAHSLNKAGMMAQHEEDPVALPSGVTPELALQLPLQP
eukprot:5621580-Amphidinium_carterae.1